RARNQVAQPGSGAADVKTRTRGTGSRAPICCKKGSGRRRAFRFAADCKVSGGTAHFGSAAITKGGHGRCDIRDAAGAPSTARCRTASATTVVACDQLGTVYGGKTVRMDRRTGTA